MPSAKKVRWAQLRVGIMAIVAMILLAILVFLLTGERRFFARKAIVHTFLDDSAALTTGSPVRLNGILIGSVRRVELSGEGVPMRIIKVDMEVDESTLQSIPEDSIASITAENVLGTKYINIKRGQSPIHVKPGGELQALDTREFDEVVASGYATLTSLRGILKRIDAVIADVEVGKGSIGKLLVDEELYNRLTGTVSEAQKVTTALAEGKGTVGRLLYDESLYDEIRGAVNRLNDTLEQVQQGQGTAGKLIRDPELYNEAKQAVAELRRVVADLNAGKGTAGKLLKDEQLHNQIASALSKVETTLDKIHTGQGTLGQLMVNPQLYESVNGMTREMHDFMKDFRANPKKFLSIKLSLF